METSADSESADLSMLTWVDRYSIELVANIRHIQQLNKKHGLGSFGSGGGSIGSSLGGYIWFPPPPMFPPGPLGPKFMRNWSRAAGFCPAISPVAAAAMISFINGGGMAGKPLGSSGFGGGIARDCRN